MKKISVIIPVYNAAPYLEECIHSVLDQDYPNVEIIAINDGSTDNSLEILQQFAEYITIIDQLNSGISHTRNKGIRLSTGEYITFLDADDFWLPGILTARYEVLENNLEYGAVYSNIYKWREDNPRPEDFANNEPMTHITHSGWYSNILLNGCCIQTSAIMVRKSVFDDVGLFDTNFEVSEDLDLWIRISFKYKIYQIDKIFAVYRLNSMSITNGANRYYNLCDIISSAINKIDQQGLDNNSMTMASMKNLLAIEYNIAALHYLHENNVMESIKMLIVGWYHNPKNTMFYTFTIQHAWKYVPKLIRNLFTKATLKIS